MHEIYFWREERPIPPAADSILQQLEEDCNLPAVGRLSLPAITTAFRRHFPDIAISHREMLWEGAAGSFRVTFKFDRRDQPTIICVSSEVSLLETSNTFGRVFAAVRELNCTRVESALR
jgi:hypothetical protein